MAGIVDWDAGPDGILHTDGYVAYEKDIGTEELIHACCLAHSRRKFIEAIKLPGLADRSIQSLDEFTSTAYAARMAK